MDHHITWDFHHSYRRRWTERFRSNRDAFFNSKNVGKNLLRNFLECALYLDNASHAIAHRLHALVAPVDVIR